MAKAPVGSAPSRFPSCSVTFIFSDAYAQAGFRPAPLNWSTRWAEIGRPRKVAAHSEPLKIQWPRPVGGPSSRNRPPWCCGWRARWRLRSSTLPDAHPAAGQPLLRLERGPAGWRCGRRPLSRRKSAEEFPRARRPQSVAENRGKPCRRFEDRGNCGRRWGVCAARRLDQAKLRAATAVRVSGGPAIATIVVSS